MALLRLAKKKKKGDLGTRLFNCGIKTVKTDFFFKLGLKVQDRVQVGGFLVEKQ